MITKYKFIESNRIAVLTGAGISAESGLKTFRENGGLWESHRVEEVATPEAFQRDPEQVWRFYKQRYEQLKKADINPGHLALKKLEDFFQDNFNLITQNVDGLHFRAGNSRIIEMHGSLCSCFCIECQARFNLEDTDLNLPLPECRSCGGLLRPDVVWFGEIPYRMEEIFDILTRLDYFLVIGTSGLVYPAAQFLYIAKMNGAGTIGINLDKPQNLALIDEFHQGHSGKLLPRLVEEWLS